MRRLAIITALAMVLGAVSVAAALAVTPGTYTPTSGSFNPANAPGSSQLTSGTVQCVVNSALDVNCDPYGDLLCRQLGHVDLLAQWAVAGPVAVGKSIQRAAGLSESELDALDRTGHASAADLRLHAYLRRLLVALHRDHGERSVN